MRVWKIRQRAFKSTSRRTTTVVVVVIVELSYVRWTLDNGHRPLVPVEIATTFRVRLSLRRMCALAVFVSEWVQSLDEH